MQKNKYENRTIEWLKKRRRQLESAIIIKTATDRWYLGSKEMQEDVKKLKPLDVEIATREHQISYLGEE